MKQISKKNRNIRQIEGTWGTNMEELLRYMYVDQALSVESMSELLNMSHVSVIKYLKLAGIYSRKLNI